MMIKKRLIVLLSLILVTTFSFNLKAQNVSSGIVNGKVVDELTGELLPGVSVSLLSTGKGVMTDKDGKFRIQIEGKNPVLVFNYLGFKKTSVNITGQTDIEVKLSQDLIKLSEVTVVVGYGTQKKREVTGAIGSVSGDQMETHPLGDINTSLQGKIAGLQITSNSGEPGAGATVRIRGASSVNGSSQPLYIVDGVPINTEIYSGGRVNDASTFSPLADINPSDIESVEVLKDGTASIYGSRASNGVIIITTKTGKNLKKPVLAFSANTSMTELGRTVGILNAPQWRSAYIDAIYNSTGQMTTKVSVIDSLHPYYSKSIDWHDIMYRQALQYKADVNISGGSKDNTINYYLSAGYKNLDPIIRETKYKQGTATAKVYYTFNKSISGSSAFNLSTTDYTRILSGLSGQSVVYQALSTMPVYNPYDPLTGNIIPLFEGSKPNPLAIAQLAANGIKRSRVFGNQDFKIWLTKNLRFTTSFGIDYEVGEMTNFTPLSLLPQGQLSRTSLQNTNSGSYINENLLTYKLTLNKSHNFNFLLGQSYQKYNNNAIELEGTGLADAQITTIGASSVLSYYNQSIAEHSLLSFFTRANYDYKGKYLISLVMRQDGSSRFGPDNKYGYFPSVSGGWRFTEEEWIKKLNLFTEGKLRGSFGVTGNQSIGNYSAQGGFNSNGTYLGQSAIILNGVPNGSLKWENTQQGNIGLDVSFLKDRVLFTADAYHKKTTDLLFDVTVPESTGVSTVPGNFGSLQNNGLEFTLNTVNIVAPFKWVSTFTLALNKNKILELPGNQDYRPNIYNMARVGQPVGVFYGLKALGIYSRDEDNIFIKNETTGEVLPYKQGSANGKVYKGGDVIWEDLNGDGIINDDDLQIIGNPNPDFIGGFQNEVTYKNFSLNALFTYSFGADVFNELKRNLDSSPIDQNFSTDQLRRWRKQGDITDIPILVKTDPMLNNAVSSRFVEDASFIRLQNIALNYKLPVGLVSRLKLTGATIGLSASNLFTWGAYTGYDPEVSSSANSLAAGVDRGSFPRSKSYNFSLNIKL
ncbi:SusC/RagA family TonB-linked outer membrane protein [Pedobacter cryophilus]|uniref:TonB-dependent receptor n=1 Tax=Pedobacter cryophilus TaxID=2571271 RepID=A0A4V5NXG3_9SPHI|nr:TonB-dependent receptor [Pedobacter cryophilus]TKB99193.1 TonB-dependent receptor [Pedobacter cryophilus]